MSKLKHDAWDHDEIELTQEEIAAMLNATGGVENMQDRMAELSQWITDGDSPASKQEVASYWRYMASTLPTAAYDRDAQRTDTASSHAAV